MTDTNDISYVLAKSRKDRAWSQKDLASRLNMRQSQISDIEAGKRDPRMSTVVEIARALGLEMVLVPRQMLPAVSYILRSGNTEEQDKQLFGYEFLDNEETENAG
jgi:transcriptional regulator with XRE-family HTH domain